MYKVKIVLIFGVVFRNWRLLNVLCCVYKVENVPVFSVSEIEWEHNLIYIKVSVDTVFQNLILTLNLSVLYLILYFNGTVIKYSLFP
jgi:hypothetical protein